MRSDCPCCDDRELREGAFILENDLCPYSSKPEGEDGSSLPYSGVIVPKRHVDTVFDLSQDEWLATFELLERVKRHLDDTVQPDGYNLGWNVGRVAGMELAHAHLHVIPRFHDEPKAGQGLRYYLKQLDNRRRDPHAPGLGFASSQSDL